MTSVAATFVFASGDVARQFFDWRLEHDRQDRLAGLVVDSVFYKFVVAASSRVLIRQTEPSRERVSRGAFSFGFSASAGFQLAIREEGDTPRSGTASGTLTTRWPSTSRRF